jgi:hypothetical protein
VTGPTWRCGACDTYNAAGERACEICGTDRTAARPAAAEPAAKPAVEPGARDATGRAAAMPVPKPAGGKPEPAARKPKPKPEPSPKSKAAPLKGAASGGSSAKRPGGVTSARPAASGTGAGSGRGAGAGAGTGTGAEHALDDPGLARLLAELSRSPALPEGARPPEPRATPEVARLLPDLFHPDGTLRRKGEPGGGFPRAWGRIGPTVADGGTIDLVTDAASYGTPARKAPARKAPARKAAPRKGAAAGSRTTPEPTRTDEVLGCGCLVVIAAAVVFGIVMLVTHWGAIAGHFGHPNASAKPTPTVTASGPCPASLAAKLPKAEAAGARLAAVYSRTDITEEYVFCENTAGPVYFFGREGGKSTAFGPPELATVVKGGYQVGPPGAECVFQAGKLTYYDKGKEKWHAPYESKSSVD